MTDAAEIRKGIIASLDAKRALVDRIDDEALEALAEHLRALVPDQHFNPAAFLADWLLGPVPALGGLTPAQVLQQAGGLERLKLNLGQRIAGVYV